MFHCSQSCDSSFGRVCCGAGHVERILCENDGDIELALERGGELVALQFRQPLREKGGGVKKTAKEDDTGHKSQQRPTGLQRAPWVAGGRFGVVGRRVVAARVGFSKGSQGKSAGGDHFGEPLVLELHEAHHLAVLGVALDLNLF